MVIDIIISGRTAQLQGPTPASESIFLDYISPWNVISLYGSLKKKHFLVSLCIAGSLLLHGLTVVSTGFFELKSMPISRQSSLIVPNQFMGDTFDPAVGRQTINAACSAFTAHNLTRPFGLYKTFVFSPFYPSSSYGTGNKTIPAGIHYEADIPVIETFLDCVNATASWGTGFIEYGNGNETFYKMVNTTVLSSPDGCHYTLDPLDIQETFAEILSYGSTDGSIVASDGMSLEMYIKGCEEESALNSDSEYIGPGHDDWRIWTAIVNQNGVNAVENQPLASIWSTPPFRALMCKPRMNAYEGPVSIWREPGESTISVNIQRQSLNATKFMADVPAGRILFSAFQTLNGQNYLGNEDQVTNDEFRFIGHRETSKKVNWDNMSVFTNAVQNDFDCVMRQTILDHLLEPSPQKVQGMTRSIEKRLFVRPLSFGLMAGLLAFLIATSAVLLLCFVPVTVCSRDTSSIAGMSTIFAQSPDFMALFHGLDLKTESELAETDLGRAQYTSLQTEGKFKIVSQTHNPASSIANPTNIKSTETESESSEWWYPLSATLSIQIPVVILPILVIIALEVVEHISASSRGIALIGTAGSDKSSWLQYIWTYVPALIMFAIRCLFTCVEFGARVVQPYSTLCTGSASPDTTIFENQLRKIPIYGLFDNFRKRQWALATATVSLFLAAITPVAVAGLYTLEESGPTSAIQLKQSSRWNLGDRMVEGDGPKYAHGKDSDSDQLPGMILYLNLSYPQWTYKDLAFAGFNLTDSARAMGGGYIDIRIPALRSQFDCAEGPVDCERDPEFSRLNCGLNDPCYGPDQHLLVYNDNNLPYFSSGTSYLPSSRPSNCTTHGFLYGKWNSSDIYSTEYHVLNCDASIEEVDVDARLQLPSLSIDPDYPPHVVPNSNKTIFKTDTDSFPGISDDQLKRFLISPENSDSGSDSGFSLPRFDYLLLDALTKGVNGVPAEELLDPEVLARRLNTVWGIIMAQLFRSNGRESFQDHLNSSRWLVHPATSQAPVHEGIFHDYRSYLVQSRVSTSILDGLLGGMVVCALFSLFSMRTRGVIPKSPCSIASVGSFVAGSKLLGILRDAEWCSDAELRERGSLQGSFSMGWWKVETRAMSSPSVPASSESSILSGNEDGVVVQDESEEPSMENDAIGNTQSSHPSPNLSSSSDLQDEEIEGDIAPLAEGVEEATPRTQSIISGSADSSLTDIADRDPERGSDNSTVASREAWSRFGIDIDGYRPLLDDFE